MRDPMQEQRALQERMHRGLRKLERGIVDPGIKDPQCIRLLEEVAAQKPLRRSLRADVRNQARERMDALTESFRQREC